jgi:hypothetical protein
METTHIIIRDDSISVYKYIQNKKLERKIFNKVLDLFENYTDHWGLAHLHNRRIAEIFELLQTPENWNEPDYDVEPEIDCIMYAFYAQLIELATPTPDFDSIKDWYIHRLHFTLKYNDPNIIYQIKNKNRGIPKNHVPFNALLHRQSLRRRRKRRRYKSKVSNPESRNNSSKSGVCKSKFFTLRKAVPKLPDPV